jgi:hypothetical protein
MQKFGFGLSLSGTLKAFVCGLSGESCGSHRAEIMRRSRTELGVLL